MLPLIVKFIIGSIMSITAYFSIKNILSILIVLVLGWKNGMLVGATGGITIGVVLRSNNRHRTNYDCGICGLWTDSRFIK